MTERNRDMHCEFSIAYIHNYYDRSLFASKYIYVG